MLCRSYSCRWQINETANIRQCPCRGLQHIIHMHAFDVHSTHKTVRALLFLAYSITCFEITFNQLIRACTGCLNLALCIWKRLTEIKGSTLIHIVNYCMIFFSVMTNGFVWGDRISYILHIRIKLKFQPLVVDLQIHNRLK